MLAPTARATAASNAVVAVMAALCSWKGMSAAQPSVSVYRCCRSMINLTACYEKTLQSIESIPAASGVWQDELVHE